MHTAYTLTEAGLARRRAVCTPLPRGRLHAPSLGRGLHKVALAPRAAASAREGRAAWPATSAFVHVESLHTVVLHSGDARGGRHLHRLACLHGGRAAAPPPSAHAPPARGGARAALRAALFSPLHARAARSGAPRPRAGRVQITTAICPLLDPSGLLLLVNLRRRGGAARWSANVADWWRARQPSSNQAAGASSSTHVSAQTHPHRRSVLYALGKRCVLKHESEMCSAKLGALPSRISADPRSQFFFECMLHRTHRGCGTFAVVLNVQIPAAADCRSVI